MHAGVQFDVYGIGFGKGKRGESLDKAFQYAQGVDFRFEPVFDQGGQAAAFGVHHDDGGADAPGAQVNPFVHVSHSEVIDRVVLQDGCDFGFAQSVRFGFDHAHGTGAFGKFGSQVGQVVDDGVQIDFQHGVVDAALHQGFDTARGERFGGFDQYRLVLEVELGQVGQGVFQVVVEQ